ncbi:MAG: TetR/AcrR family transcriptional regulator [Gemmataceae bacterium]
MRIADPTRAQRIIDAAARLFGQRHYHEVRIEDVAAKAGVSKGAVYQHFKDKEDLYVALILHGLNRLHERTRQTIATLAEPEQRLLSVVHEGVRFFVAQPYFLELIQRVDVSRSAAHGSALDASRTRFLDLLVEIIEQLNASGRWHADDPELAALALMGTMREALRWRGHMADGLPEQLVHLFLNGLTKVS